jgi:hypothetical protein
MKATLCRDYRIAGINKMVLITFAISSLMFAAKGTAQDTLMSKVPVKDSCLQIDNTVKESNRKGFYLSTPFYLYGTYSSSGLQVGYQFKKIQLRADVNFVNDYKNGKEIWFAMPTIGFFFSKTLSSKIRTYEGFTIGVETGMKNSFEGEYGFGSCIGGIEFLVSDKTAFFLEFGTGEAFDHKDGIFNTGTIIGGGFKGYLGKGCKSNGIK